MNTHSQFFMTVLTAVLSSSGGFTIFQWWLARRENRRQSTADVKIAEHDAWLKEADRAYKRVSDECDTCNRKLDHITLALYGLLDDLEDQIIPMLLLPHADHSDVKTAVRVSMRKAREAAR